MELLLTLTCPSCNETFDITVPKKDGIYICYKTNTSFTVQESCYEQWTTLLELSHSVKDSSNATP